MEDMIGRENKLELKCGSKRKPPRCVNETDFVIWSVLKKLPGMVSGQMGNATVQK